MNQQNREDVLQPKKKKKDCEQQTLFDTDAEEPDGEGKFQQQYIAHYRRISEDDTRWREAYLHLPINEEDLKNV